MWGYTNERYICLTHFSFINSLSLNKMPVNTDNFEMILFVWCLHFNLLSMVTRKNLNSTLFIEKLSNATGGYNEWDIRELVIKNLDLFWFNISLLLFIYTDISCNSEFKSVTMLSISLPCMRTVLSPAYYMNLTITGEINVIYMY